MEEKDLKIIFFIYWTDIVIGSVESYFLEVGAYVSLKRDNMRVIFADFEIKYHCFWNIKTEKWGLKIFLFHFWNDLFLGPVETYFLESRHTSLRNKPPQVSHSVVFAKFSWSNYNCCNTKMGETDLKRLLFNHWNDIVLGSAEICFPEV